ATCKQLLKPETFYQLPRYHHQYKVVKRENIAEELRLDELSLTLSSTLSFVLTTKLYPPILELELGLYLTRPKWISYLKRKIYLTQPYTKGFKPLWQIFYITDCVELNEYKM
uniref:Uncharacterized protein n=1 Tax=Glossina palpalis gambiensis TaxID=67801 RepID=A0A1B0BBJ0_9MUSC